MTSKKKLKKKIKELKKELKLYKHSVKLTVYEESKVIDTGCAFQIDFMRSINSFDKEIELEEKVPDVKQDENYLKAEEVWSYAEKQYKIKFSPTEKENFINSVSEWFKEKLTIIKD